MKLLISSPLPPSSTAQSIIYMYELSSIKATQYTIIYSQLCTIGKLTCLGLRVTTDMTPSKAMAGDGVGVETGRASRQT